MKTITIIGGGASGTLLLVNLLKLADERPLTINLVERRESVCRGVAYSTASKHHLLNVPAIKMGAFPDDVEDFHRWLGNNSYEYAPTAFVPRKIFGEYLRSTLNDALDNAPSSVEVNFIDDEASGISFTEKKAHVDLKSGRMLSSHKVVLAFGNSLPPHPTVEDQTFTNDPHYFRDPWRSDVYEKIAADDTVFIVGTGLSMVDVVMQLHHTGHRGRIRAISTRGLLPAVHELGHHYESFYDELKPMRRITDILKSVRRHAKAADSDSSNWRAVIDSLRPDTQRIWSDLPLAEKRYFMQHLSRYWNVARHRMPPEAADVLARLKANDRLEVMKGRLREIVRRGETFDIAYTTNGSERSTTAHVVVNCIGSESNFGRIESPLIQSLLSAGELRIDGLSQGLDALPDGTILSQNGVTSDFLLTLGTALKGVLLESTAIPEIRKQARDLAKKILSD
ncbi:MAG TPA: FAD/NAD(P)-binding protein [Pyrinomonadaceae bacterium]|nr:FAD/NAD(P)-binding protein [Pyrinomonadaceae bacterium]